jgi:Kef-type K+ transport system membrane component KefB
MIDAMLSTTELFLLAAAVIFGLPWLLWRVARTDYWAPLVVMQILAGIALGPGVLGRLQPELYQGLFTPGVVGALNGIALWGVMVFVCLAGLELDLRLAWKHRGETAVTAGLALGTPLAFGCIAAGALLAMPGWIGAAAAPWQFVLGIGMSCAVTALPVLILLLEKLDVLRRPLGQRILRYASVDDVAVWGVLALILLDWERVGRQAAFLLAFGLAAWAMRMLMRRLRGEDRWSVLLIWLALCAFGADWSGLHFMVGAFLAGAVLDAEWFEQGALDALRRHVLLLLMPVYFLSTGLKTNWSIGGTAVFLGAALLVAASIAGKLAGVHLAGRLLRWPAGESLTIGWLLQTKGLVMIVFANVLLDKRLVTPETFTALLLMAVASTMLTVPIVAPRIGRYREVDATDPGASSPPAPSDPRSAASSSAARTGATPRSSRPSSPRG